MGLAPTQPSLQAPLLARTLTDGGRPTPAWTGFFQDIADRLATMGRGVTDGSDAQPGTVGEFMSATAGPVSLSNAAVANVVSLSLTAGDWDVSGDVQFVTSGGTVNAVGVGIGTIGVIINATFPPGATTQHLATATRRYNVTTTTTVWLVAVAYFSGAVTATGAIRARRMR
jgi:hypothetical protein